MESTAQYWKPLWSALERYWKPNCQNREGVGKMSGTLHFGASVVQSRTARTQERLSRWGTFGEAVGVAGSDFELCARCRTATVEDSITHKVSTDAGQSTSAEPTGGTARRSPHQVVQPGFGSIGRECAPYVAGFSGRRNRSGGSGRLGGSALACHAGTVARCPGACTELNPVYRRLVKMALADLQL